MNCRRNTVVDFPVDLRQSIGYSHTMAEMKCGKCRTVIDAGLGDVSNGRGIDDVAHDEAFDGFVFGNQNA